MSSPLLPTVALVDDNDPLGICIVVDAALRDEGYKVVPFVSGDDALTYANACVNPVVLFLGRLQAYARLRPRLELEVPPGHDRIRVILATGDPTVPPLPGIIVLWKPFDLDALFEAVAEAESPAFRLRGWQRQLGRPF